MLLVAVCSWWRPAGGTSLRHGGMFSQLSSLLDFIPHCCYKAFLPQPGLPMFEVLSPQRCFQKQTLFFINTTSVLEMFSFTQNLMVMVMCGILEIIHFCQVQSILVILCVFLFLVFSIFCHFSLIQNEWSSLLCT